MLTDILDPSLHQSPSIPEKQNNNTTTDFGIQVDLNQNPESVEGGAGSQSGDEGVDRKSGMTAAERRRLNKKLSKKRKREKSQEMQRQARRQIGNIIQELYERTARFEDYAQKVEVLVELVYNNDFRDYLDQLIRMRVTYVQKTIWEYTQSILYENPFERTQDHAFYSQMVDQIYERFLEIEESSREIEKIINIYLKYAYRKNESKQEIVYNNLAVNTFNYMIQTDETLKNLLHICDKKIAPDKELQRKKLEELISIIDSYYDDYKDDYDQNSTSCANDELQSTGHSQDDEIQKRKRRRKVKDSDLATSQDSISRRLDSLVIRENERAPCRVSEQWLMRMELRRAKYLAS